MVLALVVGLGMAAIGWKRANQEQRLAAQERNLAQQRLYESLLREARSVRTIRPLGYRSELIDLVRQALAIPTEKKDLEVLRSEVAQCLGDGLSLSPVSLVDPPASHSILDFALDASGAQLAFGTKNSKVVLYDTASGAAVARLENDAPIVQLAFSPDGGGLFGRTDATGDKQAGAARRLGLVEWRRASDGSWSRQSERSMPNLRRLISTSHGVIAPIEDRSRGEFRLLDAATDRLLATVPLVPDEASPRDLDVSFDCGLAATASEGATNHAETTIDVWDVAAHRRLIRLAPGIGEIHHVSFSPDARYLACTSANGVIAYETTEFKPATTYRGWLSAAAVWAGDGTTLAVPLSQENGQFKVGLGPARSARMADCFWLPEIA